LAIDFDEKRVPAGFAPIKRKMFVTESSVWPQF